MMDTHYFNYPVTLNKEVEGGYSVLFSDIPEAITQGETVHDALLQAKDCLEEAIANRIELKLALPVPSQPKNNQHCVTVQLTLAAKAALYITMRAKKVNNSQLAKQLQCDEKEVRRLLDPHYSSKIPRIEKAIMTMGPQLSIGLSI